MAVKYAAKFPRTIPDSVNIYELPATKVSTTALSGLAKNLGLTGTGAEFITSADSITYREGRYTLDVRRASGAMVMRHEDKYGTETETAFELTDRRCNTIARRFLETAKLFPMTSAKLLRVTHLHGADAGRGENKITERILDAGVVYGRMVDDLPVIGPGGFAMVAIGPDADITGMRSVWRATGKRLGKVRINPPGQAIEAFEKLATGFKGETTVVKAQFGYFELGPLDQQRALEPVYAMVYLVRNGEVAHKSAFVVHASDKTFGKLIGSKRFAKGPQKTRPKHD